MLAEGANEVFGEHVALVNVAAHLADVALFALGLGFGLDVVLVIGVGTMASMAWRLIFVVAALSAYTFLIYISLFIDSAKRQRLICRTARSLGDCCDLLPTQQTPCVYHKDLKAYPTNRG